MSNCWLDINTAVLRDNIQALQTAVSPATQIIFVVKSDAYGHGLVPMARVAWQAGVRWFGVAHIHEALALRAALPQADILIMGVIPADTAATAAQERFTPMVVNVAHGRALSAAARAEGHHLSAHLKIDTGMGRLGVGWEEAVETFRDLADEPGLAITGLASHFSTVEPAQPDTAMRQVDRFRQVCRTIESLHGKPLMKHISSSRAISFYADWDFDAIRPGICLYGYGATDPAMRFRTAPFLEWKCRVMQVKAVPAGYPVGYYGTHVTPAPTRMAILSAGYADGYHRALSNRGHVLIRGRRCRVIGRVSMNWISVDVGLDEPAEPGDEAVLIGRQGHAEIWAGELAKLCRTIPYEILVGIKQSAEPRYHDHPAPTTPSTAA